MDNDNYELLSKYENVTTRVNIKCQKHQQDFTCLPARCLDAQRITGCPVCNREHWHENGLKGNQKAVKLKVGRAKKEFYAFIRKQPNFLLLGKYKNARSDIKFWCKKHHQPFEISWDKISSYKMVGCPQCKVVSTFEREVREYLINLLGKKSLLLGKRKIILGKHYKPDIIIPSLKLVIECNGVYYHSQQSVDDDKWKHYRRYKAFESIDYTMISIWEDDWNQRNAAIKCFLQTQLKPELSVTYDARKFQVKEITQHQANQGLMKYHPQGPVYGQHKWLALINDQCKIIACMGFSTTSRPVLLKKNTAELTRFCSKGRVRGGASRLIFHYLKSNANIEKIISFSDNDYFTGGMYPAIGFKFAGEVPPDYSTVWGNQRHHKSFTKRSNLVKLAQQGRIVFNPSTMTEKSCLEYNKIRLAWNSGKKRWIYQRVVK